jgi:hypothetical protein
MSEYTTPQIDPMIADALALPSEIRKSAKHALATTRWTIGEAHQQITGRSTELRNAPRDTKRKVFAGVALFSLALTGAGFAGEHTNEYNQQTSPSGQLLKEDTLSIHPDAGETAHLRFKMNASDGNYYDAMNQYLITSDLKVTDTVITKHYLPNTDQTWYGMNVEIAEQSDGQVDITGCRQPSDDCQQLFIADTDMVEPTVSGK